MARGKRCGDNKIVQYASEARQDSAQIRRLQEQDSREVAAHSLAQPHLAQPLHQQARRGQGRSQRPLPEGLLPQLPLHLQNHQKRRSARRQQRPQEGQGQPAHPDRGITPQGTELDQESRHRTRQKTTPEEGNSAFQKSGEGDAADRGAVGERDQVGCLEGDGEVAGQRPTLQHQVLNPQTQRQAPLTVLLPGEREGRKGEGGAEGAAGATVHGQPCVRGAERSAERAACQRGVPGLPQDADGGAVAQELIVITKSFLGRRLSDVLCPLFLPSLLFPASQPLQPSQHFLPPAAQVCAELLLVTRVVQVVLVETGLSLDRVPHAVLDFCEVGLVHAFEALAESAISHHPVQDLLEEGLLSGEWATRQTLLWRWRSQKASSLKMALFSRSSLSLALLAMMQSMSCVTSASVAMGSEGGSSRFSREGCLGLMTKRGFSVRQVEALTPSRMLMGRQIQLCFGRIVQQYQFVMGNTCQNCEKPVNPKEGFKEEAHRDDDKAAKAVDDSSRPYRPSLSKNDEKYFSNLDQTGEQRPNSSAVTEKKDPVKFKNGVIYHGEWRGSVRWGHGIQVWPDGAKYEGDWANGKANGKGKFTHVDGDVYDGEWKDDKACGYGTYKHFNGAKYEGEWLDDYQHGKGTETWVDGSKYEGYYAEGKKNGEGKYTWKDGSYFVGSWRENKINGYGVYVWSDGRQYKGDWLNNQMHGQGEYKWKDGRMYVGQYEYDKKHGFGTYTWADGRKYSGDWLNSKRHGRGKIISLDGTEREGVWEEDRRVKWLDEPSPVPSPAEGRTTKKN